MKTRRLNIIIVLLCAAAVCAGCSKRDSEPEVPASGNSVIRLGVAPLPTKGAIGTLEQLTAVGDRIGVYGVDTKNSDPAAPLTGEWGTAIRMDNVQTTAIGSDGRISTEKEYSYHSEETMYVKFMAYHPYAPTGTEGANFVAAPMGGQSPLLHFTLTGDEDLMWAKPAVGNKLVPPPALAFTHKLTQVYFQLADVTGTHAGQRLQAIRFNGVNTTAVLNLETGELSGWGTPVESLPVPLAEPVAITGTPGAPQPVGSETMLQPGLESFTVTVETTKGTYSGVRIVPAAPDQTFVGGRSYRVTLSLSVVDPTDIQATATVTPWGSGGYGDAQIR